MLFPEHTPELKLRMLWLAIGYLLVFVVVYLSISSTPVTEQDFPYEDKLFHALAYFTLMAWFAQIYHDKFQRNMIALIFILMGFLMEYIQSFEPARYAEAGDMVANITGVGLGLLLAHTVLKNTLVRFERLVFGGKSAN